MPAKEDQKNIKVMDVSSPGSTKPSDNSKNIIIKSSPILIDPMISSDQGSNLEGQTTSLEEPAGPPDLPKTLSKRINIEPLRDNIKSDQETEEEPQPLLAPSEKEKSKLNIVVPDNNLKDQTSEDSKSSNEKIDKDNLNLPVDVQPQEATEDQEDKDSKTEPSSLNESNDKPNISQSNIPTPEADNTTVPSSISMEASKDAKSEDPSSSLINKKQVNESSDEKLAQLKEAEEQKRLQEINRMIESKQYFLPINRTQKKRTKRFVIFGTILSIILIIAWLYVASNAGIIKL